MDLAFGPTAELVSIFEPDPAYGDGPEIFRNLQQAYISVMANDRVTVDFNHPLAGKTLVFAVAIRSVTAAEPVAS